jgi:hypothetical protein
MLASIFNGILFTGVLLQDLRERDVPIFAVLAQTNSKTQICVK